MENRHINIPVFIPHLGCPNACVFCNQRTISGKREFDLGSVREEIETVLRTVRGQENTETEIAFFGGSFTGIDRSLMVSLLGIAAEYVEAGEAESIRLSTRPDYIDEEILGILARYPVKTIELGLQSMDDAVLEYSKRGHTADDARRACRLVKEYGFSLVGQMMIGLPGGNIGNETATAREICRQGADAARVYPTVVFRGTELCEMTAHGEYVPLSAEDAIFRTKEVLRVFLDGGVPVIRVGLCASENLASDEVVGGANQSAIGEMAMGELFFDLICEKMDPLGDIRGKNVELYVPRGATSRAIGQKKRNLGRIYEKYGINRLKVLEKNEIIGYNIIIKVC